jgi:cold shock CspA family protein
MPHGTIKSIIADKGFGFIASPGEADVFFHFRTLIGLEFDEQLTGRRVTYEVGIDEKSGRTRAITVRAA